VGDGPVQPQRASNASATAQDASIAAASQEPVCSLLAAMVSSSAVTAVITAALLSLTGAGCGSETPPQV
jgi:hypothetical protein